MTFRCPELLALARLAPHCMGCGAPNRGDVVPAHSNQSRDGKGMGLKASDAAFAACCGICHAFIDQGVSPRGGIHPLGSREALWEKAHRATMRWLIESRLLVVRPADYVEPVRAPKAKAKVGKGQGLPTGRKIPPGPPLRSRSSFR